MKNQRIAYPKIGDRLRQLRKEHKNAHGKTLSQEDVANILGVEVKTVCGYEKGKNLDVGTILAYSKYFMKNPLELMQDYLPQGSDFSENVTNPIYQAVDQSPEWLRVYYLDKFRQIIEETEAIRTRAIAEYQEEQEKGVKSRKP